MIEMYKNIKKIRLITCILVYYSETQDTRPKIKYSIYKYDVRK